MAEECCGPLSQIRVLDLGVNLAGPFGATLLAEFGAEVIKVELPETGDTMRYMSPVVDGKSLSWVVVGRNKKSITLDVRTDKGRDLLKELVKMSDVLIENFRPGTMEKWGLGYEVLKAVNHRLIMVRVTGFGQEGPYRNRGGYDRVGAAMGGMTYLTGFPDRPPVRVGLNICDQITGMFNALGTLIALYHRDTHREHSGQWIDVSLYESIFRLTESLITDYHKLGFIREREGNTNPIVAPADNFETKDKKWVVFVVTSDKLFQRILRIIGHPELIGDERLKSNADRVNNKDMIHSLLRAWFSNKTYSEVSEIFLTEEIPFGLVYSIKDISDDPQYAARNNIVEIVDEELGIVKMQSVTPRLSETPGKICSTGPRLGQHNDEVYGKLLGLTKGELDKLHEEGII